MKLLISIFLLIINIQAFDDRRLLMDSIAHHAIHIGYGPNEVYAFVDPLCPKSQAFIELISTRKDLQEHSSYYIFLYRLKKFSSDELIHQIYQSKDPLNMLKTVMIDQDYEVDLLQTTKKTDRIISDISKVAKQMEIKRRPYLLLFDKGSKYCRVSEGTAPCLEENDF